VLITQSNSLLIEQLSCIDRRELWSKVLTKYLWLWSFDWSRCCDFLPDSTLFLAISGLFAALNFVAVGAYMYTMWTVFQLRVMRVIKLNDRTASFISLVIY